MRARIKLEVEILDGADEGYILSESNRIIELEEGFNDPCYYGIRPYSVTVHFVTPRQMRTFREYERDKEG